MEQSADEHVGGGRKPRITAGTASADMLVGGLLHGFGLRRTTKFINNIDASPGKP